MRRTIWALIAVAISTLVIGAQSASASVGEDGAFATTVPIEVPPFHGIEPPIELSYDSTRPNGPVGVGWQLDAASYIARAGRHGGAPRFDASDRFLLDGEPLVACAPGCATGGAYELRRRDFSRISFDNNRWTRWRPDGVKLVYEPLPVASAQGTYRWALARVTDPHGNAVHYEHTCDGADCYLKSIAYADGPDGCSTPEPGTVCLAGPVGARVRFHYENRPDPVTYGTGVGLAITSERLKSIAVRMGGELVRAYALTYATSLSTGSSTLRSVQTFPSDAAVDDAGTVVAGATKPQPPTVFSTASTGAGAPGQWLTKTEATGNLTSIGAVGPGNADNPPTFVNTEIPNPAGVRSLETGDDEPLPGATVAGDFDGDGRTDVAVLGIKQSPCKGVAFRTVLAKSAGAAPVESEASTLLFGNLNGFCAVSAFAADVDGDGDDDAALMNGKGWLRVARSSGDGNFSFGGSWTPSGFVLSAEESTLLQRPVEMPNCNIADVDGDGRPDLVCLYKGSDSKPRLGTARSSPGGGFAVASTGLAETPGISDMTDLRMATGDVNGDRKADVMFTLPTGSCGHACRNWKLVTGFANGDGGFADWKDMPMPWTPNTVGAFMSGDVDGDARADAVLTTNNGWSQGGDWSGWQREGGPGAAVKQIAVARNADGRMEAFGIGMDDAVWHIWQTSPGGSWSGWDRLGGFAKQIAVARNADGRLELFAIGSDDALHHMSQTSPGGSWSAWRQEGGAGAAVKRITVGRNADGRLEVFGVGMDDRMWHIRQTSPGGPWGGWAQEGDPVRRFKQLHVVSNADGRLEVFAIGTDDALWRLRQASPSSSAWEGWQPEGGPGAAVKQIAVAKNDDGRLEVLGIGMDDRLWRLGQTSPGGSWEGWSQVGGPERRLKRIATAANADGRLEVFAIATDGVPWRLRQASPGGSWSGWDQLSSVVKEIAPASNEDGRLELFAIGADDALHHMWQWSPLHAFAKEPDHTYVATSTKGAATTFVPKPPVAGCTEAVGDRNGDGRDDLLGLALATGNGQFSSPAPRADGCHHQGQVGDTNGDGRADSIHIAGPDPNNGSTAFTVGDAVAPTRPADPFRWMPADVTGTGRQDLVYVHFRNPGYEVYTLRRQPSGTFTRSPATIAPKPDMPLTNPNAAAWMPIDVGGGAGGAADGKTDLVLVEGAGAALRVNTLLSTGSAWRPEVHVPAGAGSVDVQSWRPANVNRDGRSDLVHFVPLGSGVRLEYLLSSGSGSWTYGSRDYFTAATATAPALVAPNARDFLSTDVDGDGVTDFAFAERTSNGTIVRTLVGNGDASWSARSDRDPVALTAAQIRTLTPMDFNGDGMRDLALIRSINGCLKVTAFVSTGGGWTYDGANTPAAPSCRAPFGLEDSKNIRVLDVNHDNRDDVLHLSRHAAGADGYATAAHLLLNLPGTDWSVINDPSLPLSYADTWAYGGIDSDSDGRSELVHVDGGELGILRWATRSNLLTDIANGRGATTSVSYRALVGGRSYLPSGSLPTVVGSVTIRDAAHSPAVDETTSWTFGGARWSDAQNRLLGFASVRSTQANTVELTRYDLSDACGARPTTTSLESRQGKLFSWSRSAFRAPGGAAPYTCLEKETVARDCDGEADCTAKITRLEHDRYGNVTRTTETRAQRGGLNQPLQPISTGERRTTTDFRPNTAAYIVDRPARTQTYEFDSTSTGTQWVRKAATEHLYDDDPSTSWNAPPDATGALRVERAWLDRGNRFVETRFAYDGHGNLLRKTGPTGVVEHIEYDSDRSLFPIKRCTPVGCTHQTWNVKFGVPKTAADLNGQVTSYDYDAYGRQTKVTGPDGSTSSTSYLDEGSWEGVAAERQRIRTEISDGSAGDGVLWKEELLDGLGRVYKTLREGDGTHRIVTETRFDDASSRPAATSDPYLADDERGGSTEEPGTPATPTWTQYRYDAAHRLTATILADGATSETEYHAGAARTRDPMGREKTTVRDEFGRVIRVEELDRHPCSGCPAKTSATTYAYDALDHRTRITDAAGNVTETVWDSLGRKVSERDPDRGSHTWTWRDDGAPNTATDAKGQVTRWFYDSPTGRLIRREERTAAGDDARTTVWTWDRLNQQTHGYSIGRVVRVAYDSPVAAGATESWYDRLGRVSRSRRCVDGSCAELGFGYDRAGRMETIIYPDAQGELGTASEVVSHAYDDAGRLKSLTGHDPTASPASTAYAADLSYTPLGQLTKLKHSNGITDTLAYDATRHWLDTIDVAGSTPLYSATHQHYRDGRIKVLTETQAGMPEKSPTLEQQYEYDDFGRLTKVTASDPARSHNYSYDEIGRMTSSSDAGAYSYDDPAHVHAPTETAAGHTRSYDANGNVSALQDPRGRDLTIDWTVSNMPERISGSKVRDTVMGYDDADQRVLKTDELGTTRYFDRYVEEDRRGRLVKYYWVGDRLVARRDGDGTLADFHQDRLGSTRLVTNPSGGVVEHYDYDPFGKPIDVPADDQRTWRSERFDHDSGLVYMNARFYDPELSRFISADSIVPDEYRPQSLDRYAYVENDPVNYTDPSGHARMQVEVRKDQFGESSWGAMYARSLTAGCGPWSVQQCVAITSSTIISPERDRKNNDRLTGRWMYCTHGDCVTEALDPRLRATPRPTTSSNAEVAVSSTAAQGESVTAEPDHVESTTYTRSRLDQAKDWIKALPDKVTTKVKGWVKKGPVTVSTDGETTDVKVSSGLVTVGMDEDARIKAELAVKTPDSEVGQAKAGVTATLDTLPPESPFSAFKFKLEALFKVRIGPGAGLETEAKGTLSEGYIRFGMGGTSDKMEEHFRKADEIVP